jgi:glutamyl-tRNA synthetase
LAKRHGDTRLATLREQGLPPERLVGRLAWSCGLLERPEPCRPAELLAGFSLDRLPRGPWVLDVGHAFDLP